MKIAVTAAAPDLGAAVDPRFGRCAYLIIVDEETGESTVLENANSGQQAVQVWPRRRR